MLIRNPFVAYRQWRERKLQTAETKTFTRGFEYAAACLLSGQSPDAVAQQSASCADAFKHGVRKALGEWHDRILPAPRGQRRVVCAAVKYPSGHVLLGARHFGPAMRDQYKALGLTAEETGSVQGFLDQWDVFMTRQEALETATKARQILIKTHPANKLFSEDIY